MRRILILSTVALISSVGLKAQTVPPPATGKPAPPRTPVRATARPTTVTIQVTDALGTPLADTQVTVTGTVSREGTTAPDGTLRLTNMRAGTYRFRFTREGSITLERDVTIRAGEMPTVDVALSAAPAVAAPPPAPVAPPAPAGPVPLPPPGDPKVTAVPLFLERNFIGGREGRKDSSLGCTATGTATLHQLRDTWANHAHEDADEWIYVVAGEGTLRIGTAEHRIQAGSFSLVPHATAHTLVPQGRNPLIVTSVLSGPACKG